MDAGTEMLDVKEKVDEKGMVDGRETLNERDVRETENDGGM